MLESIIFYIDGIYRVLRLSLSRTVFWHAPKHAGCQFGAFWLFFSSLERLSFKVYCKTSFCLGFVKMMRFSFFFSLLRVLKDSLFEWMLLPLFVPFLWFAQNNK